MSNDQASSAPQTERLNLIAEATESSLRVDELEAQMQQTERLLGELRSPVEAALAEAAAFSEGHDTSDAFQRIVALLQSVLAALRASKKEQNP